MKYLTLFVSILMVGCAYKDITKSDIENSEEYCKNNNSTLFSLKTSNDSVVWVYCVDRTIPVINVRELKRK